MKQFGWLIPVIFLCIFIAVSFLTRNEYGWNWDSYQHFARGQAYFRFFSTGRTTNEDVKPYEGRISFYEKTPFDFSWASKMTIGHPPTTDTILAFWNQIFYKRFGWFGDLEAYHLYGIFLTGISAIVVFLWSKEIGGWVGATVSLLAFGTFPLLFAEQHFNIKDPAVSAYNLMFLFFFWLGMTRKKAVYLLAAAGIGGISLGTKFNILFLFPIILVWSFWFMKGKLFHWIRDQKIVFIMLVIAVPIIMTGIFFVTYPALWTNPIQNVLGVIRYYQDIGGNRCPYVPLTCLWFVRCSDWNTARLFLVTIPIPTIVLAFAGSIGALKSIGRSGSASFLWFIAASFLVIRVVLPVNSLYGGSLRQIMELIGPMALLSGTGALWIAGVWKKGYILLIGFLLLYIPVIQTMISLHPNENLYTNIFATVFWSNEAERFVNGPVSYGNVFKEGVDWINLNADKGARITLASSISSAVPSFKFRQDLSYTPRNFSAYSKNGEYIMDLIGSGDPQFHLFGYTYVERVLDPVFQYTVKGYPTLRVWKNDLIHTKKDFQNVEQTTLKESIFSRNEVTLRFTEVVRLQKIQITTDDASCRHNSLNSYILVSRDGETYTRMYEPVADLNIDGAKDIKYLFAGEEAGFIKIFSFGGKECDWKLVNFAVSSFK